MHSLRSVEPPKGKLKKTSPPSRPLSHMFLPSRSDSGAVARDALPRSGFSLALSLVLLGFLLLLALSLCAFLTLHFQAAGFHKDKIQARLNAVAAARIALGHLQQFIGRDCTATAGSDSGDDCVVAVFGAGEKIKKIPLDSSVLVSTQGTSGEETGADFGTWIREKNGGPGRFAFFASDESQKISVGTTESSESIALPDIQARRQLCAQRHEIDNVFSVKRANIAHWRAGLSVAETWKNLALAWLCGGQGDEPFPLSKRIHTRESQGVLSDAAAGGLRINLDRKNPLPADVLPCEKEIWEEFFRPEISLPAFAAKPETGLPISAAGAEFAQRRFPILSGLHIRFGFFNARSDGGHRVRFTCDVQLWNPYPFPLYCADSARIALLDFEKMPRLDVTNRNTGAAFSVDMSAFPIKKFGGSKQTASDGTINAYLDFSDKRRFGMPAPGLLAGEVFNFSMPDPAKQPQGFARLLSGITWKMQTAANKPTKPPPGANGNNWFHAVHDIEICGTMPAGGVTFHLREARGKLPADMRTKDYSPPVLTLKNVPWEDFALKISGKDYSRAQSSSYGTDEAQIALSLKLKNDSPDDIAALLEKIDPRAPVLDFSDAHVAGLFQIETDVVKGLNMPLAASREENFLWAAQKNNHGDAESDDSFSEMRAIDRPTTRPISVASLRRLPVGNKAAGSLHQRYPAGREHDAVLFDGAFFAGAWNEPAGDEKRPWSRNPWLAPNDMQVRPEDDDVAARCFVRGSFNVNCAEADAWRVALARILPNWQRKPASDANNPPETKTPENVFFRLSFGAAEPRKLGNATCDFNDSALRACDAATRTRAFGMQGFRALEPETRDRLASALAEKIRDRRRTHGAFRSLAEFALSDVLPEAIKRAGCNSAQTLGDTPPAYSPLRLNAGDILESLLPALAVRGDTFSVRVTGGVAAPFFPDKTTARSRAEIVVQRLPEFLDNSQPTMTRPAELNAINKTFGRRLKIVSWRQLDAEEE